MACMVIIGARGGSKRLPGKNLRVVGGKTLIARAVDTAWASSLVNAVWVSTDDDEIAEQARQHAAEVIQRPAELATDTAHYDDALLHALASITPPPADDDVAVSLSPVNPLTTSEDIGGAVMVMAMASGGYDSIRSVRKLEHPMFLMTVGQDGFARGLTFDTTVRTPRTQDMAEQYAANGAFTAACCADIRQSGRQLSGRIGLWIMPPERSIDIDTQADLDRAEQMLKQRVMDEVVA